MAKNLEKRIYAVPPHSRSHLTLLCKIPVLAKRWDAGIPRKSRNAHAIICGECQAEHNIAPGQSLESMCFLIVGSNRHRPFYTPPDLAAACYQQLVEVGPCTWDIRSVCHVDLGKSLHVLWVGSPASPSRFPRLARACRPTALRCRECAFHL